jgi:phospholipid/cholesterol/gamma-HCH transport system ATP-binding protein
MTSIIEVKNLKTYLGNSWVQNGLTLNINQGEILGIAGGSGSGKTTLLRTILMLQRPNSGSVKVFGQELTMADTDTLLGIQRRWGVLFQQNALFSSLNVLENTAFPLQEQLTLDTKMAHELALLKILMVGLPANTAVKYPAELSGGMQKRAALARAMILDPELLFLDEPTSGLDPNSASGLDELILNLQTLLGLTIIVITHDLDTLWRITNRVAFLAEGKVLCVDSMPNLVKNPHPLIQDFFNGPRGGRFTEKDKTHGN